MKKSLQLIIGGLLCVLLVGPYSVQAASITDTEVTYRALLLELIEVLQKQIVVLQAELKDQPEKSVAVADESNSLQNEVDIVAKYVIDSPTEIKNISDREQRMYFSQVFAIFPDKYDAKLSQLLVFEAEDNSLDAFVETIPPTNTSWVFAVSEDVLSDITSTESVELIVHELGHLVSYEEIVDMPTSTYADCHSYFEQRGCPTENSYLGQFVNQFWSDADLARAQQFTNREDSIETASVYYKKHSSQFVTDYAALSPEEDFAESFMYFIFSNQTSGDLSEQKVDFFTQFPELVEMKNEILGVVK